MTWATTTRRPTDPGLVGHSRYLAVARWAAYCVIIIAWRPEALGAARRCTVRFTERLSDPYSLPANGQGGAGPIGHRRIPLDFPIHFDREPTTAAPRAWLIFELRLAFEFLDHTSFYRPSATL